MVLLPLLLLDWTDGSHFVTPERTAWLSLIPFPNADAHVLGRAYVGPSRVLWPNNVHASPFMRRKSHWEQDDFLLHLVALNVCIVKRAKAAQYLPNLWLCCKGLWEAVFYWLRCSRDHILRLGG